MAKGKMDETLISFLGNDVYMVLMVCVVLQLWTSLGLRRQAS